MSVVSLKLAAICMTSTADKEANIAAAERYIREAAKQGADWVQLPEMFPFLGSYDLIYDMAEDEDGPLCTRLAGLAKELKIVLFAGTMGEKPRGLDETQILNRFGQRRVYNTSYIFGRDGSQLAKYRKTHLFNLYDEQGQPLYCESDGFIAGHNAVSLSIDGLRVALSVCYDLRFPEFFQKLAAMGHPDVIAVPSAFTKTTGRYHWELLLRARAVEWQAYVYAANQSGQHGPGKESFGHAMIVDPWGVTLANTGEHTGVAIGEVNSTMIKETRAKLPALTNRRQELYK